MLIVPEGNFHEYYLRIKRKIWERDNYTCQYCGLEMKELYGAWQRKEITRRQAMITADHIEPKNPFLPFRDSSESNLITACWDCNQKKGGFKKKYENCG